jgi:hypothetical protein
MLASHGGADDPLLPQSGRQRDIHGVNVRSGEQFLVTAERLGLHWMRDLSLTFVNKGLCPRDVAAGESDKCGVAGIADGLPVFAGDEGSTENAPSASG